MATSDLPPPEPLTVTVKAAALMLGLSNVTVYKLLDAGDIQSGYTSTGRRLVHLDSLRGYVANLPSERPSGAA
jgi:excisionase family DNA binding protein